MSNGADLPDVKDLAEAQEVLKKQFPDGTPVVMDPFCGGGSTLVEAQRLGLSTLGSDLNPVPAIISRALTEISPRLHGRQPLHPESGESPRNRRANANAELFAPEARVYEGLDGLARDITYYAEVVHDELEKSARPLYPARPGEQVVAWLWCRTAHCPNPTCGAETLLTTSWWLSKKKGGLAWIEPRVEDTTITLEVRSHQRTGQAPDPSKVGDGVFECLICSSTISPEHLRLQGKAGSLGLRLVAIVSEVDGRRTYRTPDETDLSGTTQHNPIESGLEIPINPAGREYGSRDMVFPSGLISILSASLIHGSLGTGCKKRPYSGFGRWRRRGMGGRYRHLPRLGHRETCPVRIFPVVLETGFPIGNW